MKRNVKSRTKKKQRRRMMLESLETRQLLAVDTINIDLSGNGGTDLLGPSGGGSIHDGYGTGTIGLSFNTSNVPDRTTNCPWPGPTERRWARTIQLSSS